MPQKKVRITRRDAVTGQYVSEDYAKKHPKTTVLRQIKFHQKSKGLRKRSSKTSAIFMLSSSWLVNDRL
jgi:hypothetical protein